MRFIRSARKYLRLRSEIPTTSWTKPEKSTSSNKDESNSDRFHSKRMTANHKNGDFEIALFQKVSTYFLRIQKLVSLYFDYF